MIKKVLDSTDIGLPSKSTKRKEKKRHIFISKQVSFGGTEYQKHCGATLVKKKPN